VSLLSPLFNVFFYLLTFPGLLFFITIIDLFTPIFHVIIEFLILSLLDIVVKFCQESISVINNFDILNFTMVCHCNFVELRSSLQ
jgi:hypothetical protein